jgi:hypothetical protein
MTLLRVGLVLAAAVAAAVVANVVLLGVATGSSERVGNLSPRAELTAPARPVLPVLPVKTVPPARPGESRDRERDD